MKATLLGLLLVSGVAAAQSPLALAPLPRALYEEAQALEGKGDLDGAALRYRAVLRHDPAFARAAVDLGRVREAQGDLAGAEEAYRLAPPGDADALMALGQVQLARGSPAAALRTFKRLRVVDTASADPLRLEAEALSWLEPEQAAERYREYLELYDPERNLPGAAQTAVAVAEALPAEQGLPFLHEAVEALPALAQDAPFAARLDRLRIEAAAYKLASSPAVPLTGEQTRKLDLAGRLLPGQRLHALEALVVEAPASPRAWAALALAQEALGRVAEADRSLRRAEALAPLDPQYPARLGDLLYVGYGGSQDAAAAEAYARALRLDPTWADLWFRRGLAERRAGDLPAAARSFARFLELEPEDPRRFDARRAIAGLGLERLPAYSVPEAPPACAPGLSEETCAAFWVAVVLQKEGRLDEALEELAPVRSALPGDVRALNLEAGIRVQQGDSEGAIRLYQQSLAVDPGQESPLAALWDLLRAAGRDDEAARMLEQAERAGAGTAHYLLARRAFEQWHLWEAQRQLDAYFSVAPSGRYQADARDLRERLDRRRGRVDLALAGGGLLVVLLGPVLWWWRRSGTRLEPFLDAEPRAYPEAARLLSAIRHEVLKHSTTTLDLVADRLEEGDPGPARWLAERLYAEGGALPRFREYLRDLALLGRVHGHRLALRHDPVLGPVIAAMDQLDRLSGDLYAGRSRCAPRLHLLSAALNDTGYRNLGRLLRTVCLLELDEPLIRSAWQRAAGGQLSVELPEQPALLRMYRADLQDILANLFRNAVEAGASRVGVRVGREVDWVTGLERVVLSVADDAPGRITTAVIRGRYIERGLGLTVDRISRSGGSIHVESAPGYEKAVVVRLPAAEES